MFLLSIRWLPNYCQTTAYSPYHLPAPVSAQTHTVIRNLNNQWAAEFQADNWANAYSISTCWQRKGIRSMRSRTPRFVNAPTLEDVSADTPKQGRCFYKNDPTHVSICSGADSVIDNLFFACV